MQHTQLILNLVMTYLTLKFTENISGSRKYQHADLATGSDAHLVLTNTDGSISLQCNSCDWATDILKPTKARQKLKAHEFKHSSRIIEKDEQISNKSAIIPEQGVISQGQYSAWLNDPDVQIKLLDGSISTFAEPEPEDKNWELVEIV